MTETPILDEGAVEEIEARAASASPKYVVNWSKGEHALLQASGWRPINEEQPRTIATFDAHEGYCDLLFCAEARTDIPALCATVKHLRDRERTILAVNAELIEGNHAAHVALDKAGIKREDVAWEGPIQHVTEYPVCDRIGFLQSQLEQLRAENDDLRKDNENLSDIIFNNQHAQSAISRAIQLCKDKAAEHLRIADVRVKNQNDDGATLALTRADAINDIREELEKL